MKKVVISIFIFLAFIFFAGISFAQTKDSSYNPETENFKGVILGIDNSKDTIQNLTVKIIEGIEKNKVVKIIYDFQDVKDLKLKQGETLFLSKQKGPEDKPYYVVNDRYRLPRVLIAIFLFLVLIILIAGKKGIGSIVGLGISLGIIFLYIVPSILSGHDPLTTSIIGSTLILLTTTYVAHGFSKQTTIALFSTFIALILTLIIATLAVVFTSLSGFGTEEAYELHMGLTSLVNFRGLLLSGVIIATIGALNDVTTTQAATIFELHRTNPSLDFDTLLKKGLSVGREHVISLINTLVLAFVGSSLALFLVFFFNPTSQSIWVILNSEIINEEVIKTIAGTSGLMLSMPIVTILSAFICADIIGSKKK